MLKKILLITILLFTISTQSTFAGNETEKQTPEQITAQENIIKAQENYDKAKDVAEENANKIKNEGQKEIDKVKEESEKTVNELKEDNKKTIDDANKRANEAEIEAQKAREGADLLSYEGVINEDAEKIAEEAEEYANKEKLEARELQETLDNFVNDELINRDELQKELQKKINQDVNTALSESDDELKKLNTALSDDNATLKQQKQGAQGKLEVAQQELKDAQDAATKAGTGENYTTLARAQEAVLAAETKVKETSDAYSASPESKDDIADIGFKINVNDISPGMQVTDDSVEKSINRTLGTVIQSLMMLLGSLALLIMTIGAGFIILHHGQDELLSKGKSIFMSGVYALVVALGSYYLVSIFRFLLFTNNGS